MSDINLFTDLFNDGLTTEQERVIDEILRELESPQDIYNRLPLERCNHYISELEDDGVHPPLTMRLEQEEGEDVWCTTCHLRWFCKMRRKIKRIWRRREVKFVLIILSLWVGFPILWFYSCSVILP